MNVSYIERKQVVFDLSATQVKTKDIDRYDVTLDLRTAKSLMFGIRDALRQAGEDV